MHFGPTSAIEEISLLLAPLVEFLHQTCLLCLAVLAVALVLLAVSVIGIESHDAREARRILKGDLDVPDKKLHEIQEELQASDSARHRRLARDLAERFPPAEPPHQTF